MAFSVPPQGRRPEKEAEAAKTTLEKPFNEPLDNCHPILRCAK